jgi:hypothetical protein
LSAQKGVQDELLQRFRQIQKRLCDLKFESDEVCTDKYSLTSFISFCFQVWKTLETAELRVIQLQTEQNISVEDLMMSANDFSTNAERKSFKESDLQIQKRKQDLAEIEDFYLNVSLCFNFNIVDNSLVNYVIFNFENLFKTICIFRNSVTIC